MTMHKAGTTVGLVAAGALLVGGGGVAAASHSSRPAAEHVPAMNVVRVIYDANSIRPPASTQVVIETGAKAAELVRLFNALKPEPRGMVHCLIAGGPQTRVVFRSAHHRWVASQSACTNITVTRDGKALPTLLPSKKWTAAVNRDLGD